MIKKTKTKVLFQNDGKPYVPMTGLQWSAKRSLDEKMRSGHYRLTSQNCLCGHSGDEGQVISLKDRYGFSQKVVLCLNCSLVFLATPMNQPSTVKFYEEDYRGIYNSDNTDQEAIFKKQFERGAQIFNLCEKHFSAARDHSHVLDIGCNAGGYLKIFQDNRFEVMGIDLDDRNFDFGRKKGITNLRKLSLEDLLGNEKATFDVIIMSHVLEHVQDPVEHLKNIHSILRENGLFYVEVPNIDFEVKDDILAELQNAHNWYFDEFTLSRILKGSGFEILAIKKPFHIGFLARKVSNPGASEVYRQACPDIVEAKIRAINKIYFQNMVLGPYRAMRQNLGRVKRQIKSSLSIKS